MENEEEKALCSWPILQAVHDGDHYCGTNRAKVEKRRQPETNIILAFLN
jgi:hypothetical protein